MSRAKFEHLFEALLETPDEKAARDAFAHTLGVAVRDHERMTWLGQDGRWCASQEHTTRRVVHFFVGEAYRTVEGDTLREAIDRAMEQTRAG